LRVIPLASAGRKAGLGELDFEVVVFVWPLGWSWIKGNLVVGRGIGDAFLQTPRDIVCGVKRKTAALNREHRER
jgi:hypothetical protein